MVLGKIDPLTRPVPAQRHVKAHFAKTRVRSDSCAGSRLNDDTLDAHCSGFSLRNDALRLSTV